MKHVLIDQETFESLIEGKVVLKDGVQLALSDIGWYNMIDIIESKIK